MSFLDLGLMWIEDPGPCLFSSLSVAGIRRRGEEEMVGQVNTLFGFQCNFLKIIISHLPFHIVIIPLMGLIQSMSTVVLSYFFEVFNIWIILNDPERLF